LYQGAIVVLGLLHPSFLCWQTFCWDCMLICVWLHCFSIGSIVRSMLMSYCSQPCWSLSIPGLTGVTVLIGINQVVCIRS